MALIFRPYRTLPDGRIIWAKNYGKKAWPIYVDDEKSIEDSKSDAPLKSRTA